MWGTQKGDSKLDKGNEMKSRRGTKIETQLNRMTRLTTGNKRE